MNPAEGYWLGITDLESSENKLVSHITQMEPNYQNWNYGEPSEKYKGARCAKWSVTEEDEKSVLARGHQNLWIFFLRLYFFSFRCAL